jgi:predicted PurR-regulated permease PerM
MSCDVFVSKKSPWKENRLGLRILARPADPQNSETIREAIYLLKIIVFAIGLAFCFIASSLCVTIILSVLLAILVDPLMVTVERLGLGRTLAAGISVLCAFFVFGALTYGVYQKAGSFAASAPVYSYRIRKALRPLTREIERLQEGAENLSSARDEESPPVKVFQTLNWPAILFRGVGSISGTLVIAGIAPFLAFFMLIRKERMHVHFSRLLTGKIDTGLFISRLKQLVHGYVLGSLLAGTVLSGATVLVFWFVGLHSALPLGIACGFLNTVPFLGGILATGVALAAALLQFDSLEPLAALGLLVPVLHLIAVNFVIPRIVGPRLLIGPVATTVGMLFWGWLWGAMGVLLAVPLTASIKLVADLNPRLDWLAGLLGHGPEPASEWPSLSERARQRVTPCFRRLISRRSKRDS